MKKLASPSLNLAYQLLLSIDELSKLLQSRGFPLIVKSIKSNNSSRECFYFRCTHVTITYVNYL